MENQELKDTERDGSAQLLSVRAVSKRFAGTLALNSVSLDTSAGEIHALLGENGAGKSTLIKVLAGVHKADSGQILWNGKEIDPKVDRPPITFIHQDLGLVDSMTVAENVAIQTGYPRRRGLIDWQRAKEAAQAVLQRMGGGIDPEAQVRDLSAAEKSIIAIARALAVKCELLVLDEPTAALPEADVEQLLAVLRLLRSDGIAMLYVTHRLDEVFRVANRVTVLRDGSRTFVTKVSDTTPAALIEAIIGRRLDAQFIKLPTPHHAKLLEVRNLASHHVGPVSFSVTAGEILGLVGLRGAGHDVIGRAIFGAAPVTSGSVELNGREVKVSNPRAAVQHRIGFASAKRREESIAPTLSVRENLYMSQATLGDRLLQFVNPATERAHCSEVLRRLSVRPPDTEKPIITLSGGNQQKVVVSRWIEADSLILILEEPTLGVDVGSKFQIYSLLKSFLETGRGVLLVSSDFEEVAGMCHRALIFDRGRVVRELSGDSLSVTHLTAVASGATAA